MIFYYHKKLSFKCCLERHIDPGSMKKKISQILKQYILFFLEYERNVFDEVLSLLIGVADFTML